MLLFKNDVAVMALARFGSSHTSIDVETDNSTQAKLIRKFYSISLDNLLRRHSWTCATGFTALPLVETDPISSWGYSYRMPDDCLMIRKMAQAGQFYLTDDYEDQIEPYELIFNPAGMLIYTNLKDAEIKYTIKLDENSAMQSHFGRALAAELAMDIAPGLITNNYSKVKQLFVADAMKEINQQIAVDISMQPQARASDSPYVRARL